MSKKSKIYIKFYKMIKVDDFTPNYWNYQTNYIKTSCKTFVDLFCIIFKLELDQDISEVCAKFQRVSIVLLARSSSEPLVSLGLVTRNSIVLGLGSIVTIVCISLSQPILWDVPRASWRPVQFGEFRTESQVHSLTKFSSLCKLAVVY